MNARGLKPTTAESEAGSVLLKLALLFGSFALVIVIAEFTLRVLDLKRLQMSPYKVDEKLGWKLVPDQSWQETKEGNAKVVINSSGFRDQERTFTVTSGTYRIAILGDSFIEAKQVDYDKSLTAQLEKQLTSCPVLTGKKIEVLNFGVQGYGTAQEYLLLREEVWKYFPEVVVLAMLPSNDLYNNHPSLNPTNSELAPYFTLDTQSRQLKLQKPGEDDPVRYQLFKTWQKYARKYQILRVLGKAGLDRFVTRPASKVDFSNQLGADYQEWLFMKAPELLEMKESWEITEALIEEMNRSVEQQNRLFHLFVIPSAIQVHPDASMQREFQKKFRLASISLADERLESLARSKGIPVLSLASPFLARARAEGKALHGFANAQPGFGHWNERGHSVAAELLSTQLCEIIEKKMAEEPQAQEAASGTPEHDPLR